MEPEAAIEDAVDDDGAGAELVGAPPVDDEHAVSDTAATTARIAAERRTGFPFKR
jgi:hypothetical protein